MKMDYTIIKLNEKPELKNAAAEWFHEKWGIPYESYYESMTDSLKPGAVVRRWYIAVTGERIVGEIRGQWLQADDEDVVSGLLSSSRDNLDLRLRGGFWSTRS